MPNNGPDSLTDAAKEIYNDESEGCTSYSVKSLASNSVNVLVQIDRLHGDEWFQIEPGQEEIFRVTDRGINKVQAKAASGTADILKGVVAQT